MNTAVRELCFDKLSIRAAALCLVIRILGYSCMQHVCTLLDHTKQALLTENTYILYHVMTYTISVVCLWAFGMLPHVKFVGFIYCMICRFVSLAFQLALCFQHSDVVHVSRQYCAAKWRQNIQCVMCLHMFRNSSGQVEYFTVHNGEPRMSMVSRECQWWAENVNVDHNCEGSKIMYRVSVRCYTNYLFVM